MVSHLRKSNGPSGERDAGSTGYIAVISRHRWLVLGFTVWACVLAALYTFTRTTMYTAKTVVLVQPVSTPIGIQPAAPNLDTEAQIAASVDVAKVAAADLGGNALELERHVSVDVPKNTNILVFSYSNPDPRKAQQGAEAFAAGYLTYRESQAISDLTDRVGKLQALIKQLEAKVGSAPSQQQVSLNGQIDFLNGQLGALEATTIDPGAIISHASLPTSPSSPHHALDLALGLILGFGLGVALAFVRDRSFDRSPDSFTLEDQLGAPVLGIIPTFPRGTEPDSLITVSAPSSGASEAFRTVRTGLLSLASRPGLKTIMITSAQPGDGKTSTTANLAASLAQMGKKVVAISADMRKPRLHGFFGIANQVGLAEVLTGERTSLKGVIAQTSLPKLGIITSGQLGTGEDASELLQSQRMADVLERCRNADFVLIDCPPVLTFADPLAVAPLVDGVLFVADGRRTSADAIVQARNQLERFGAKIIGGVVNNVLPHRTHGGYYAYHDPSSRRMQRAVSGVPWAKLERPFDEPPMRATDEIGSTDEMRVAGEDGRDR